MKARSHENTSISVSENSLIEEYKAAQMSLLAVSQARTNANYTEQKTIERLHGLKIDGAVLVNPSDVPEELKNPITFESLNAHFQKIQALQIEAHNSQELERLSQKAEEKYKGKKVVIKVLENKMHPVAIGLRLKGRSELFYASSKAGKFSGIITNINLAGNSMMLKPTAAVSLFNSSIKNYKLFVIDPRNFKPLVSISFR